MGRTYKTAKTYRDFNEQASLMSGKRTSYIKT